MADAAVIFVGPSRPRGLADDSMLEIRPPAARGDVVAAASAGAPVIGVIDGVFHHSLAITPREVRQAAALGARLFGGASMGALRAVECPDAMIGVGEIYAAFARGELSDDDEVAVSFDPDDDRLVAHPLLQIRAVVTELARERPAARPALAGYLDRVRALPFFERTRPRLRDLARALEEDGIPWEAVAGWLDDDRTDVKRRDAALVVARVRAAWLEWSQE
jgi:TfuA protein